MDQVLRLKLIRSRRRTLALEIAPDGTVLVRGPLHLSDGALRAFALSKRSWIEAHLARLPSHRPFLLEDGARLPLYGEALLVRFDPAARRTRCADGVLTLPGACPEARLAAAEAFYRRRAKEIFQERLAHYGRRMGLSHTGLAVTGAKTRWGSCNQRGEIRLNWRLLLGQPDWLDYVVVHELAHLREMNHSPAFWAEVEAVLPDHRARKKELNQHQGELQLCIVYGS